MTKRELLAKLDEIVPNLSVYEDILKSESKMEELSLISAILTVLAGTEPSLVHFKDEEMLLGLLMAGVGTMVTGNISKEDILRYTSIAYDFFRKQHDEFRRRVVEDEHFSASDTTLTKIRKEHAEPKFIVQELNPKVH